MIIERISADLGIPIRDLTKLAASAPYRYKVYEIPKKSGKGTRTIAQPAREVKEVQRYLVSQIINKLPVHVSATAYKCGTSIRLNAENHVDSNFLLKMDFRDFFPSITNQDFESHLERHFRDALDDTDLRFLVRILFRALPGGRLSLSIGSPGSSFVSNTVMFEFDSLLSEYCQGEEVCYTRYADDLALSTNRTKVLFEVENRVKEILKALNYPRLQVNDRKTIHVSRKHRRSVTGVVLSSQRAISMGRSRKRLISAMIHRFALGSLDRRASLRLQGLLGFAADVEPSFIEAMTRKYGKDVIERIREFSGGGG